MSANNKLVIFKEDMEWCVEHRDADTDGVIEDLGGWVDLESAIECANDYMSHTEVEYSYTVVLPKQEPPAR